MCDEIRELGFDAIEASHGLALSMMPGLIKAVEEKRIRVEGVHNFCPQPIDVRGDNPDAYTFTSHRSEIRERALRLTKETMQAAARLGARYVVLHMGAVHLFLNNDGTRNLERLARRGWLGSETYARCKGELVRKRTKLAPIYYERARAALHELAPLAEQLGLVLAVEGRSHFEQVPGESEFPELMKEFAECPSVAYWHDFGHIQRKHNLLLLNHEQYLETMQPHLYGAHINDVQWPARDHRAPFFGDSVDFNRLMPRFFSRDMPMTWELSRSVTKEQILQAKKQWDALMLRLPGTASGAHCHA